MTRNTMAADTETWVWNALRVIVPRHWEVLAYSKNYDQGRLLFADALGHRLELNWQRGRIPDGKAYAESYLDDLALRTEGVSSRISCAGWSGLERPMKSCAQRHYVRCLQGAGLLAEAVFLGPQTEYEPMVLAGLAELPAGEDRMVTTRCFGMEITHTVSFRVRACDVKAASVSLALGEADSRRSPRLICERRGMVKSWLKGSVRDWLRQRLKPERDWILTEPIEELGHSGWRAHLPKRSLRSLLGGKVSSQACAAAWLCPECNRLYFIQGRSGGGRMRLGCCSQFGEELSL